MIILGLNSFVHDSSAALLVDGQLVAAAEEERFTRVKHTAEFPARAVEYCLSVAGVRPRDLDHVAISWQPWRVLAGRAWVLARELPESLRLLSGSGDEEGDTNRFRILADLLTVRRHVAQALDVSPRELRARFHWVRHHEAHAASTFFASPFERAAVCSAWTTGESGNPPGWRWERGIACAAWAVSSSPTPWEPCIPW